MQPENMLFPVFSESPIDRHIHGHKACHAADQVGDRFRQEDAVDAKSSDHRKTDRQRNDDDGFPKEGKEDCLSGFPKGHKGGLARKLQRHQEDSEKVNPKRADPRFEKFRFTVEEMDKKLRSDKQKRPDRTGEDHTARSHEADSFLDPLVLSGPIVESDDRLGSVCQAVDRHGDDFPDRIDDRHDTYIEVSAVPGKHCIAHDLNRSVCNGHDESGKAKARDLPDQLSIQLHVFSVQPEQNVISPQEAEDVDRRNALGNDGSCRRTIYTHMKDKNKDRVQDDIQDRTDQHGKHPHLAKSLGIDEVVHAKAHHHKEGSCQIDEQIGLGIRIGLVACAEQVEHRPHGQIAECHQNHAGDQKERKGVSHDLFRTLHLACSSGDGTKRCPSHTEQIGKCGNHRYHRECQSDPRKGFRGRIGEMTDIDPVYHAVEHVYKLCHRHRDRQSPDIFYYTSFAEIILRFQNQSPLLLVST